MADQADILSSDNAATFAWHPEHAGKTPDSLYRELVDRIQRDQRSYQAALEMAEKEEHGAFTTVRELEKRWSDYDFAWFELPPEELANRIVRFEQEREARQELISWREWKATSASTSSMVTGGAAKGDWRENLTEAQRKRVASALSILVIVGGLLFCIAVYFWMR